MPTIVTTKHTTHLVDRTTVRDADLRERSTVRDTSTTVSPDQLIIATEV